MASKSELDSTYMGVALLHAKMSKAQRQKVGACLVTRQGVCIPGFNGRPIGLSNECEIEVNHSWSTALNRETFDLVTKPSVIHSELNCILKAAKEGVSCFGATMYVSLSPCVPCAAMLINAGITRLLYKDVYRDESGVALLRGAGILVEQFKE